eukprot:TRINITY_DN21843_c0_g1_i1.p2 TRINITY_DN21843_c0_g1~~TRINITY_DN21843_c0_g1_i1.p2  ORF type:complete len:206 (-),score=20.04 TRINITY_DN21843_c0_g1_i1:1080-1697(-)
MDLKELLGDDLYNQVIEKTGDKHKVAIVSDGNWMPKEKFNEANTARKQAEDTLKERDQQLEQLRKSAGDNETLQADIKKLQDENKAVQEKYESDMKALKLDTALKLAIGSQVHDADYAMCKLDKEKIVLNEDGTIKSGLDEQVTGLLESAAFLFVQKEETAPTAPLFKGIKPPDAGGGGNPPADPKGYDAGKSLAEQRNQGGSGK